MPKEGVIAKATSVPVLKRATKKSRWRAAHAGVRRGIIVGI
jgi:hypothetical protein